MTRRQELELVVHEASRETQRIVWSGRRLTIGRHPEADIRIQEPTMSARHAELTPVGARVSIRDLDSLNGTLLNGVRVVESMLRPGDRIEIGLARIEVVERQASDQEPVEEQALGDATLSSRTVKIELDRLRRNREELGEDERILQLRDLFEAIKAADDPDELLDQVRAVLSASFRNARIFILRPKSGSEWNDPALDDERRRPSMTFISEAARSQSAILSTSLPDDRRFSAATSVRISGIETAIAAPTSCDGQVVAVVYIDRLGLPPFERRDLNLLGIAANHISAVLESVKRFADLRRANAELREAREGLADLNRSLEQRVEERTVEIRRQADEIQKLAAAKDELVGIAAHDIRGPLTVIQGTVELLRLRVGRLDDDTLSRSLNLVHGAARGLGQLLSELLDAKSIEAGKVDLHRVPTSVSELLQSTLPVVQLAAEHKNMELKLEVDSDLRIEADPQRLSQAVTNLLLNAVKFSKAGTRILLEGRRQRDEAEIVVQDQGIGIPKEEIDRIFGTFEQGKAGQEIGGSGLGLMIAKRIVELHGGLLSVKSKVGKGTRFLLTLPALPPSGARPETVVIEEELPEDDNSPIGF